MIYPHRVSERVKPSRTLLYLSIKNAGHFVFQAGMYCVLKLYNESIGSQNIRMNQSQSLVKRVYFVNLRIFVSLLYCFKRSSDLF